MSIRFLLFLIIFFLILGCAKQKEMPPMVEIPQEISKTEEKSEIKIPKKERLKEEKEITLNATEEVFKEEPIFPQEFTEKDKTYKSLYGRGTPPLLAIFFDYDKYTIRDDMWDRIEKNAKYLLAHPEIKIELQGNCDERGTNEYNMALGAKRAGEVKKVLIKLGIEEERIRTISFGEERPLATCHDESCWALNRRVDFVIIK